MSKKHSVPFHGYRLLESFRFVPHLPKITATYRPTKCITETFLCAHTFSTTNHSRNVHSRDVHSHDVHPCYLVPRCPLPRCPPLHFRPCHDVHSRHFSRPAPQPKITKKIIKPRIWGFKVVQVIDGNISGKLVNSAGYNKQQVCAYLQLL